MGEEEGRRGEGGWEKEDGRGRIRERVCEREDVRGNELGGQ